jgi:hypothetical protein
MTEVPGGFDVRAFTRTAQGRFSDELDLDLFATKPLTSADRAQVRFLARVEGASMDHFRDVLMTATHKDARVTAFLVTWAYERQWLADALNAVLAAHGEPAAGESPEGEPRRRLSERRARRGPLWRALGSIRQGEAVVAAHVTLGLVDEWVMAAAYEAVAECADNGTLTKVLDRITAVRLRHQEFFATEADRRLRESGRAVRLTRSALRHAVWPIGALRRAAADRDLFGWTVFGGAEGRDRAEAIGAWVAGLPGLAAVEGSVFRILMTSARPGP